MADPFRLRILKALAAALEEINPDNGYTHDMRGKVFRGRDIFGDDDPIPMISILEAIEQDNGIPSPRAADEVKSPWILQIQGFVTDDYENPTDPAHSLMAEVKKRLVQERRKSLQEDILGMNGRVDDLQFTPGVVRPADEISARAYFWLRITLDVVENLSDPYL